MATEEESSMAEQPSKNKITIKCGETKMLDEDTLLPVGGDGRTGRRG